MSFFINIRSTPLKYKFSNTAASFTAWSIFFSSFIIKNDTDQFLFGNFVKLPRSIALFLKQKKTLNKTPSLVKTYGLFIVYITTLSTTFGRRQQQVVTELVSKWISKKVTKYLLLLNTFKANFLVFLYYWKMFYIKLYYNGIVCLTQPMTTFYGSAFLSTRSTFSIMYFKRQ